MKYTHEQEKSNLEFRVERSTAEMKSLMSMMKSGEGKKELERQVNTLQEEIDGIKEEWQKNVESLRKEKETAEVKAAKYQKQLEKLKQAPKPVQIDLTQTTVDKKNLERLNEEIQLLSEKMNRLKSENGELKEYIERLESQERKLKNSLRTKENEIESQAIEHRKTLNAEK